MKSFALFATVAAMLAAAPVRGTTRVAANPIRKVVTMLENVKKKVEAEGEKEEELYKKYMCYCKTGVADLSASISAAGAKGAQLGSDVGAAEEQLAQVKQGLKDAQAERAE